ncbi:helix-turn-helix transcriptional regulator [Clostridium botulinum]|uniref:XRE family transcriptional regulator n=1 Tax=Clostridium botulinum TaxID=1491 RepID=A0A846HXM8_CLOBO|nr:helix-turn-helix transcriptional regulator [Clostridium botulinum]NEZ91982.1 XRE family transcriptional regulator [Clostridium botulinum]
MLGDSIKELREKNKLTLKELADKSGVGQSTINDIEKGKAQNPKAETLSKLANVFNISVDELLFKKWDEKSNQLKEENELFETGEFTSPQAAMQFILKQPAIMGFGGFDANKMTDEEIIEFANELLNLLKMLGPKYNK